MQSGFIFDKAPFRAAHASTVAEGSGGLVAAWFAGTREGHRDVGIWLARHDGERWSAPREVAAGAVGRARRHPCWNPVLHPAREGPLLLFYKLGPSPSRWWGMVMESADGGGSWTPPRRLPDGIVGPVKNKPVTLSDGRLLCPSSTEHDGWQVHLEVTADLGRSWERYGPLNDRRAFAAIQPAILRHPDGRLQLLCRTRQGVVAECWSMDDGRSWSAMRPTPLPNPDSGIDAVTLRDGRALVAYNRSTRERSPLTLALSDDGIAWRDAVTLETGPGEFSYPAVIQDGAARIHVTYTWNRRRIAHRVLDPAALPAR